MASSDVVIGALGVNAAPIDYVLPQSAELQPLAVTATFDGSGAAGDYNPTLVILSQGGAVVARVPTDTTVTAGNDAEVTWAPFLRSRATSSSATSGTQDWTPNQPADLYGTAGVRASTLGTWFGLYYDTTTGSPLPTYLNNFHENVLVSGSAFHPINGTDLFFRFVLGPKDSEWRFDIGYVSGPDFGILNIQIASIPDGGPAALGVLNPYPSLTYLTNPGIKLDTYNATPGVTGALNVGAWPIRLTGDDGALATTWPSSITNGGAGIYAVRLFVDGKNAASTGYKIGLWSFALNRVDGDPLYEDPS